MEVDVSRSFRIIGDTRSFQKPLLIVVLPRGLGSDIIVPGEVNLSPPIDYVMTLAKTIAHLLRSSSKLALLLRF